MVKNIYVIAVRKNCETLSVKMRRRKKKLPTMKTFALTNPQTKYLLAILHSARVYVISIVLILSVTAMTKAANRTWTNGGGTGNWSDASNWSGGVPGSGDVAVFNSTYTSGCNINTDVAISGITISAGYTGTIVQQSGHTVALTSNYSQSDGVFIGGNANIAISGSFTLSTGTFTSTSATMSIQNSFTVNSGTFNHNSGTLLFDQAGATTINVPNGSFDVYNLTFNSSVGNNMSNSDTLVVHGTLSLLQNQVKNGVIRLASGATYVDAPGFLGGTCVLEVAGAVTVNVTCAEFFGILLNNAGAIINMPSNDVVIDGAVTINAGTLNGGTHNIEFLLNHTQNGGTFNASTGTMSFDRNFIYNAGTFTHNSGSVAFVSNINAYVRFNNTALHFYNMQLNKAASTNRITLLSTDTLVTDGAMTLTQGLINTGYIEPDGTLSIGSNYTGGSTRLLITAPNTYTFSPGTVVPYLILDNPNAVVNLNSGASVMFTSNINVVDGTFNCGSNQLNLTSRLTVSGGTFISTSDTLDYNDSNMVINAGATFDHNNGTIVFSRPINNINLTIGANVAFYDVVIDLPDTTTNKARFIIPNGDTMIVEHNLSLQRGYLYTGVVQLKGDLDDPGTFSGGTGTLYIAGGSGSRSINLQSPTWYNLVINDANASVAAPTGSSLTFNGAFTMMDGEFYPDVFPITITGAYTQSGGYFWDGVARENFYANFTMSGGEFYATADTLDFESGSFTLPTSGTGFYHNNGTILVQRSNGGCNVYNAKKQQFYNLVINLSNATLSSSRFYVVSNDTLVVDNNLTLQDGNLYSGTVELRGGLTDLGSFSASSGTLYIANGTGPRSLTFNSDSLCYININDANASVYLAGTQQKTMAYTFTLSAGHFYPQTALPYFTGVYTQNGGTYHAGTARAYFASTVTLSSGAMTATSDTMYLAGSTFTMGNGFSFSHNNGTLEFGNLTTNTTFNIPVSFTAYNVYIKMLGTSNNIVTIPTGDTLIVNNKLALVQGRINTGYVKLVGDFADLQTFSGGSATIYLGGSASPRTVNLSANTLPNLYINDANLTLNGPTSGTTTVQGNVTLNKGTLQQGSGSIAITGTFTQTGGTFNGGAGNMSVNSTFTVSNSGTQFKAPAGTLTLNSSFTVNSPATFNANGGTLEFTGGTNSIMYYTGGTLTLNNLLISLTGSAQLRPRQNTIVGGNLTIGLDAILNPSAYNIDMTIKGNYNDQNPSGGLTYGNRTMTFSGSSAQTITSSASQENFYNLSIANTSGGVRLNSNVYVYKLLTLASATGGKVYVGNNNLIINSAATISGGTTNEFVVTDGTGSLMQENIGATGRTGGILFPVGKDATHYAPVTVNNAGTADRFEVNISNHAYTDPLSHLGYINTNILDQTYNVEEQTPGGSNVTLTIQWNATDELPSYDRASCSIRHYTGGAWQVVGTDGPASGSGPYTLTASGITSFSPFDGGSGGNSLPIELASFTGRLTDDNQVELDWSTEIEVNNHFFTIERSADGVNYTELATVEGAGNSTQPRQYTLLDAKPLSGTNYYRLKQTDYDGKNAYVGTVAISTKNTADGMTATLYPNPLNGRTLGIELTGQDIATSNNINVTVTDMTGRTIYTNNLGNVSQTTVNLPSGMAAGMYLVSVNNGTQVYQQKLLVR